MSSALKLMASTCSRALHGYAFRPEATSPTKLETVAVSEASTGTPSGVSSASDFSSPSPSTRTRTKASIPWEDLSFGARIEPEQRHAKTADDIYLLNAFLELSKVQDVDGSSVKLVLQALKFLRGCSYSAVDITSILAHASAYFADVYAFCGDFMCPAEVGHVLVISMFVAHSYVQDETCPLRVWHQYLFKRYSSLKGVSAAVMRVMSIRGHILRLADDDLKARSDKLSAVICSPVGLVELVC